MTDALQEGRPAGGTAVRGPVEDWAADYDLLDPGYVVDPYAIWDRLRADCPVAHSDRWGGSWMPTRYADVAAVAHDVERFSSREVGVIAMDEPVEGLPEIPLPPISVDPTTASTATKP